MCNLKFELQELVETVVDEFIQSQKTFTAYDVTKEIRSKTNTQFLHHEVRWYIHQLMRGESNYTREQDFSIHPNGPFVYKPVDKHIDNIVTTQVDTKSDMEQLNILSKLRFCVPSAMLKEIGLYPDDEAYVYAYTDTTLYIDKGPSNITAIPYCKYIVDKYNNVRLSVEVLNQKLNTKLVITKPISAEIVGLSPHKRIKLTQS